MMSLHHPDLSNLPLFAAANARNRRSEARPLAFRARWIRKHHPSISPAMAALIASFHFGEVA